LFMDMSGEKMDFWSIHLYDFNLSWANTKVLRRGSNLEATFDMMEQYSHLSFDEVKPFVISEYGGRALTMERGPWSPLRDWLSMKSMTSMLLSFSERPQHIVSAIPFVIIKAEWGRQENGDPYPWRLMRNNNELAGQEGSYWVYTEMVKFFQLWSEVKGLRVDSESNNPDVQTNAFIDGNKLYVVLNNLLFDEITVSPEIFQVQSNPIRGIKLKHLHLNTTGDTPLLDEAEYSSLDSLTIGAEGSAVLAYTFQNDLLIQDTVSEVKYYADRSLTPIVPYARHSFNIDGVTKGDQGEALLRLGMGRRHGLSLRPSVTLNGFPLEVPENYMGYDQSTRGSWFGVIEVPVPFYYLQENNEVTVQFTEKGGHISSMALRVFNHSGQLGRSDSVKVNSLGLSPAVKKMGIGETYQLIPEVSPITATDHTILWSSSDEEIAIVDEMGNVMAVAEGEAIITATAKDGGWQANSQVQVLAESPVIKIAEIQLSPAVFELAPSESVQMQVELTPIDAQLSDVEWKLSDNTIARIDKNGLLTGFFDGVVEVIALTTDGLVSDTSVVQINAQYLNFVTCTFLPTQFQSDTVYNINIDYSSAYSADIHLELRDANGEIVGEGQTSVSPSLGTVQVRVVCPLAPAAGNTYTLNSFVLAEGPSGKQEVSSCSKENVRILAATSIVPKELKDLRLFPNPSSGRIEIHLPNLLTPVRMSLWDLAGRKVYHIDLEKRVTSISLPELSPAMYVMKIESDKGLLVEKIQIQNK
ncbi:MAG: Ig-like domain-containing protein, partial [Bacteroidota bacterium]